MGQAGWAPQEQGYSPSPLHICSLPAATSSALFVSLESSCHPFFSCEQELPRESWLQLLQRCLEGRGQTDTQALVWRGMRRNAFQWVEGQVAHSQTKCTSPESAHLSSVSPGCTGGIREPHGGRVSSVFLSSLLKKPFRALCLFSEKHSLPACLRPATPDPALSNTHSCAGGDGAEEEGKGAEALRISLKTYHQRWWLVQLHPWWERQMFCRKSAAASYYEVGKQTA